MLCRTKIKKEYLGLFKIITYLMVGLMPRLSQQPFKVLLSFKHYSEAYLYHNSQRTL